MWGVGCDTVPNGVEVAATSKASASIPCLISLVWCSKLESDLGRLRLGKRVDNRLMVLMEINSFADHCLDYQAQVEVGTVILPCPNTDPGERLFRTGFQASR